MGVTPQNEHGNPKWVSKPKMGCRFLKWVARLKMGNAAQNGSVNFLTCQRFDSVGILTGVNLLTGTRSWVTDSVMALEAPYLAADGLRVMSGGRGGGHVTRGASRASLGAWHGMAKPRPHC